MAVPLAPPPPLLSVKEGKNRLLHSGLQSTAALDLKGARCTLWGRNTALGGLMPCIAGIAG
jgi:hypothetical protein